MCPIDRSTAATRSYADRSPSLASSASAAASVTVSRATARKVFTIIHNVVLHSGVCNVVAGHGRQPRCWTGLLPLCGALDRRLLRAADADLDLPRLRLLGLPHVQLQHTVLVLGLDRLLRHPLREPDRAREGAVPALEAVVAPVLDLLLALTLRRHGQRVRVELDRDLLLRDAGE